MKNAKAQVAMEYILIFGFSLIAIGILWALSSSNIEDTKWELQVAYAKNALDKMVKTADIAYVQGSPTQIYISVDFPENVKRVYIQGNQISLELEWKGFLRNISASSVANLTGYISPAPRRHVLLVKAGNIINITES